MANKAIDELLKQGSKTSPIHPNLTDYVSNGWALTYSASYPSRISAGSLWYLFKASPPTHTEILVDNGTWLLTLTPPSNGSYFFTGFNAMNFVSPGYYRNGGGCTVKVYYKNVQVASSGYNYGSGFILNATLFDRITLTDFWGGYQADDLCHTMGIMYLNGYVLR